MKAIKKRVRELLASGEIKGFLGLCKENGHIGPHLFSDESELEKMAIGDGQEPGDARYPLNKLLIHLSRAYPEERFGVLVRGCDERGLKALFVWNQLNPEKVVPLGIACPESLAEACECLKPHPDEFLEGEKVEGCAQKAVAAIEDLEMNARFALWMREFDKCIKCYGCRDICPMCFCKECTLETDALVHKGEIPPESPIFHLIRAVHMAGRCVDCGLCNEACPADIPLRTLYKKVSRIIDEAFDYRPGYRAGEKPPLNVLQESEAGSGKG